MSPHIECLISSRIPTDEGLFHLHLFRSPGDSADHLALTLGEPAEECLVRIHSECFTGDVLGSRRCDCGEQLQQASRLIAREGSGVLIYLRQEGRGIGLLEKLKAYNLQDQGHDTVDANRLLGHQADEREYDVAAAILRHLGVRSPRLLTNNPAKVESLQRLGFADCRRLPLQAPVRQENVRYLETKARRMRHLLELGPSLGTAGNGNGHREPSILEAASPALNPVTPSAGRPTVTLTYAQSVDGSITVRRGEPMMLSGPESLTLTHSLRGQHDAILIGIETVLSDDPRLTVRRVEGPDPQPIVLDSRLRTPITARLLRHRSHRPWIATTQDAPVDKQRALEAAGAVILRMPSNDQGQVALDALMPELLSRGIRSVMVEGGGRVITSFLNEQLVDRMVLTIAPLLVGGFNAVGSLGGHRAFPTLRNPRYQWVGSDLVLLGELESNLD